MDKATPLTIALPKGRLQKPVVDLLEQVGIDCGELREPSETHHPCPRYRVEISPGKTGRCASICGVRSCRFGSCGEGCAPGKP